MIDDRIQHWLRLWERLLATPQDAHALMIYPRTDQLLDDLRRARSRRYVRVHAPNAARAVESDLGFQALLRARGGDPTRLVKALRSRCDSPTGFEALISALTDSVCAEPSITKLRELIVEATLEKRPSLHSLTRMLASVALAQQDGDHLRGAPRRALAAHAWRLQSPPEAEAEIEDVAETVRLLVADSDAVLPADRLDVRAAAKAFLASGAGRSQLAARIMRGGAAANALNVDGARALTASLVHAVFLQTLHARAVALCNRARPGELANRLHARLDKRGWLPPAPMAEAQAHVPEVNTLVAAVCAAVFVAADIAGAAASADLSDDDALALAHAIAESKSLRHGLARRDLHERVASVISSALDAATDSLNEWGTSSVTVQHRRVMHDRWIAELAKIAGRSGSEWLFPTITMDPKLAVEAVVDGIGVVAETPHIVVWLIHGMSASAEPWKFDEIEFLDPADFDFGHSDWLRPKEHRTLCRVCVDAPTPAVARIRARARIETALDVFSLAFSLGAPTGFHPRLSSMSIVETDAGYTGRSTRSRNESHDVISGAEASEVAAAYRDLVIRRRDRKTTDLDERLLDSIGWYRRARWETDVTRRLLGYWIVLERLFVGDNEPKRVAAERAAKLSLPLANNDAKRWDRQILLGWVYDHRNDIVHAAGCLDLSWEALATEVELIVEDCLMKTIEAVLDDSPSHDVQSLLDRCQDCSE